MMPYLERKRVIPCPDGTPLKRIHPIKCRCRHGFKIDLGVKWEAGRVIKCPKCNKVCAETDEDGVLVIG